jgi:GNAT superfamily N-acetyltransferase
VVPRRRRRRLAQGVRRGTRDRQDGPRGLDDDAHARGRLLARRQGLRRGAPLRDLGARRRGPPDLGRPLFEIVTFADRPDLEEELHALARLAYADQPGRSESRIENWPGWGLHAHRPDAYFIALEHGRVLGYGYLELEGETWSHGFMAVARAARGRGVAGALKRAQINWAKSAGIGKLRTATEVRLDSMLALNRRFGYVLLYEEIVLRGPVG